MYTLIETPGAESAAARLCLLAILLSLAALLISDWLAKRSRTRLGG
jgi:molybdate transport system permease protein